MPSESTEQENPSLPGLAWFFLAATVLFVLRVIVGVALVPPAWEILLTGVSSLLFVSLPVFALFKGASAGWTWKSSGLFVFAGVAVHVAGFLAQRNLGGIGLPGVFANAFAQTGLIVWCMGLGACVSLIIKEKNLILPVAIFLAGFDIFLVFNPSAPTAHLVQQYPEVFRNVAMSVPKVRSQAPEGEPKPGAEIEPIAHVGPADLFCIATFFACLFRFKMRVRETVRWLIPVLILYLILAFLPFGFGMLPALVPIGLTVLIVNFREFQMTKEERNATWGVAVVALLLASYGIYRRITDTPTKPPAEPSIEGSVPMPPESAGTPLPNAPR